MNVRALLIALACAVLVGGSLLYLIVTRPAPDAGAPVTGAGAPVAADARETPPPSPPSAGAPVRPSAARASAPAAAPPSVPTTGSVRVESDVPGAQVFIDRKFLGRAPVTIDGVTPGEHRLNVEAEGFDGIARTIDVAPGTQRIEVKLREIRLDVAIDVVHKHRIGSCTGRLSATVMGVRYETMHAEDAFDVGLPDLETFTVDYIEKNLRVKRRGGKTYNFTDPEGLADRLFVFHRDVTKAREQLAAR